MLSGLFAADYAARGLRARQHIAALAVRHSRFSPVRRRAFFWRRNYREVAKTPARGPGRKNLRPHCRWNWHRRRQLSGPLRARGDFQPAPQGEPASVTTAISSPRPLAWAGLVGGLGSGNWRNTGRRAPIGGCTHPTQKRFGRDLGAINCLSAWPGVNWVRENFALQGAWPRFPGLGRVNGSKPPGEMAWPAPFVRRGAIIHRFRRWRLEPSFKKRKHSPLHDGQKRHLVWEFETDIAGGALGDFRC